MKFPVALTLWKKSQKINCFYACQSFFYSLGLFLCLNILCVFTSCSRQNQIEELFEKWILVDEVIWQEMMENQQDTDISTYLQNVQFKKLINDYEDFRKTEFYQNLVISENYGEAMKNLDAAIQKGDINQIRIAFFRLEQLDKLLTQQSNQEYAALAGVMLIFSMVISILLYIIFKNYEKKRNEAKQLGIYTDVMIKGTESERTRISKEIHDTVLQDLKALSLKVELTETDEKQKNELISQTNDCIKKLRSICRNLTPVEFKNQKKNPNGFIIALQNLTEQFTNRTKTACILKIQDQLDISSLTLSQTINVFRIIQEALNNAEKHSEATNVSVIITNSGDTERKSGKKSLKIFITDNGKGFDTVLIKDNHYPHVHFGLYNMKERAKDIDALLEINSEEGEGTEVKLEVPLK